MMYHVYANPEKADKLFHFSEDVLNEIAYDSHLERCKPGEEIEL
jgi:hypothetical protein